MKQKSQQFASDLSKELKVNIAVIDDIASAMTQSDICVTCTTSRQPFISLEHLPAGIFIAAVGSGNEDKQETRLQDS